MLSFIRTFLVSSTVFLRVNTTVSVVNGAWSDWGAWSISCSEPCGTGFHQRWRYCDNPTPSHGGLVCAGSNNEKKECNLKYCNGLVMSKAGESCTYTCYFKGLLCLSHVRTCNDASSIEAMVGNCSKRSNGENWKNAYEPSYDTVTKSCFGYKNVPKVLSCLESPPPSHQRVCNCSYLEDLKFHEWSIWSECSTSCNGGLQFRSRDCVNSNNCNGILAEKRYCNEKKCPINGKPGQWSSWTSCSATCGGGQQTRTRSCNNPPPRYDGMTCYNELFSVKKCNVQACEINATYTEWSTWSACPVCNEENGKRHTVRYRSCVQPMYNGTQCTEETTQWKQCDDTSNVFCPAGVILLDGILVGYSWKNQYFYKISGDYQALQQNLNIQMHEMFLDAFHSNLTAGFLNINLLSVTQAPNGIAVSMIVNFKSLNHHQYIYLTNCLYHFKSITKIDFQVTSISINQSHVTKTDQYGTVPLTAPTINFTLVVNSTTFTISWHGINQSNFLYVNQSYYGGYTVFYRLNMPLSDFMYRSVNYLQTYVNIVNLQPATEYLVYVVGYNVWGNGIHSNLVQIKTQATLPKLPPTRPSIDIYEVLAGEVLLFWDKVPLSYMYGQPTFYNIYSEQVITRNTSLKKISYFELRNTTLLLTPDLLYNIRICPENEVGEGNYCFERLWTTLPSEPLWKDFHIVIAPRSSSDRIALSWRAIPLTEKRGDLLSYCIEYYLLSLNGHDVENVIIMTKTVEPQVTQFEFKGLALGAQYFFRIKAVTTSGSSPWSDPVYGSTCACPLSLSTSYFLKEPYIFKSADGKLVGVMKESLELIIDKTCGICNVNGTDYRTKVEWNYMGKGECQEKSDYTEFQQNIRSFVDLSLPIYERQEIKNIYGGKFLPIIQHPGSAFVHISKEKEKIVGKQMLQLFSVIPFVIILALMVVISGIFAWFFERKTELFNERFSYGIFQGMYMTYVTLTTVGYGDKFAQTKCGRSFMVLWILTSLILSGIFIGSIVSVITTSVIHSTEVDIHHGTIGAISDSEDFMKGINLGARMNEDGGHTNHRDYTTFEQLSNDLEAHKLEGVLINTYWLAKVVSLFTKPDMQVSKIFEHKRWYGVILNGEIVKAHDSLVHNVKDNELLITLIYDRYKINAKIETKSRIPSLAEFEAPQMQTTLIITTVGYIVFVIVGAMVWYCGFRRWRNKRLSRRTDAKRKIYRDSRLEMMEFVSRWNDDMTRLMKQIEEKHIDERIYVWKNLQPGVITDVRPRNYNITTVKLDRAFIAN